MLELKTRGLAWRVATRLYSSSIPSAKRVRLIHSLLNGQLAPHFVGEELEAAVNPESKANTTSIAAARTRCLKGIADLALVMRLPAGANKPAAMIALEEIANMARAALPSEML